MHSLNQYLGALDASERPLDTQSSSDGAPIFVLATGWRTGSTLLQRIVCSDERVLLWGEPFGRMGVLPRVVEMINCLSGDWPPQRFWYSPASQDLSSASIANLFPAGAHFRQALRSLLDQWLEQPALTQGFTRWGFKEVRIGAVEARVLTWLYPGAKFLVIARNPFEAYRSAATRGWQFYDRWPDRPVDSAAAFARHWNRLAWSWTECDRSVDVMQVRYEDLIAPSYDFQRLQSWLQLDLQPQRALGHQVGGTRRKRSRLSACETYIIRREARAGMRHWGYE